MLTIALFLHFSAVSDIRTNNFFRLYNFGEVYISSKKSFLTSTTGLRDLGTAAFTFWIMSVFLLTHLKHSFPSFLLWTIGDLDLSARRGQCCKRLEDISEEIRISTPTLMQWIPPNAMNGLKYFLLQLKDCIMETSCWQERGAHEHWRPRNTRMGVEIKENTYFDK